MMWYNAGAGGTETWDISRTSEEAPDTPRCSCRVLVIDPEECLEARFFTLAEFPDDSDIHLTDRPMVGDLAAWMKKRASDGKPSSA